jgi:ribosomal protein L7/L12
MGHRERSAPDDYDGRHDPRALPQIGDKGLIFACYEGLASGSHLLIYADRIERCGWLRKNSPTETILAKSVIGARLTTRRLATSEVLLLLPGQERTLLFNRRTDAEAVHDMILRLVVAEHIEAAPSATPALDEDDSVPESDAEVAADTAPVATVRPGTVFERVEDLPQAGRFSVELVSTTDVVRTIYQLRRLRKLGLREAKRLIDDAPTIVLTDLAADACIAAWHALSEGRAVVRAMPTNDVGREA